MKKSSRLAHMSAHFTPEFYDPAESEEIFSVLQKEIEWKTEKIKIFGREVLQPRLTSWYGDEDAVYTYSGLTMRPLLWHPLLSTIKAKLEKHTHHKFNGVLLNYYRTGSDYMGWHSDNEKELGENPFIASLSFGGMRKFQLRHKASKSMEQFELGTGSLLIMRDDLQKHWQHRISPTRKPVGARINLTFRQIRVCCQN